MSPKTKSTESDFLIPTEQRPIPTVPTSRPCIKRLTILFLLLPLVFLTICACTSAPRYRASPAGPPSEDTGDNLKTKPPRAPKWSEIVRVARTYIGTPYVSGGTTRRGLDCSGLVLAVYRECGIPLPRTSRSQSTMGNKVDLSNLRPADLVFFRTSRRAYISHVGIYIGQNRFIHASTRERSVRIDRLDNTYFRNRLVMARRVVH